MAHELRTWAFTTDLVSEQRALEGAAGILALWAARTPPPSPWAHRPMGPFAGGGGTDALRYTGPRLSGLTRRFFVGYAL